MLNCQFFCQKNNHQLGNIMCTNFSLFQQVSSANYTTDEAFEYTQYAVIRDRKNLGYYFFTQFNNNLFFIDLSKIDFSKVSAAIPSVQPQWQIDVTQSLIQGV